MNLWLRRSGIIGAWLFMALVIAATGAGLFFFIVVAGLSGGDGKFGALAGLCFILLVIEFSVVARQFFRRRPRYGEPEEQP